ncbi:restriction endonuclease subunit S [[Ruminococcus] torques]|uniref:restriction endonuclease subunit S n=1 Tax=[Ruminococcus] torques TaxID=33039 RepID=UPI001EE00B99|nr:restriction endonuclease subunit S [[Ruminococcus] torques]MCG4856146.1 restriction endonuclease subunit S [[Ruminococcus] torques]
MINNNLLQQLDSIYKELYPYQPSDSLPKGWQCVSLGSLCDSISIKHSFDKEELIFLNTGDVEDGCFLHDNYSLVKEMPGQAKKSIMLGDILYSEIRPINRHFAFVNFAADDYVVSTKLMVIRSRGIASRRLYHFLTTQDVIDELQLEAESRSGTFPQIRFENVQRLPIIIAPPEIETKFAGILELYYRTIDSNIKENKNLIAVRDSLLPRIMSGELDVSNIDI